MGTDDGGRIIRDVAELKAILTERGRDAEVFRGEMRDGVRDMNGFLVDHAAEDTRRFEKSGEVLDEKVAGLYEYMEKQANAQRTRAWQIAGIVMTAVLGLAGVLIAAHKSGLL
jgi:hypothetical protein